MKPVHIFTLCSYHVRLDLPNGHLHILDETEKISFGLRWLRVWRDGLPTAWANWPHILKWENWRSNPERTNGCKLEDDSNMHSAGVGSEQVRWIHVAQSMVECRNVGNTTMSKWMSWGVGLKQPRVYVLLQDSFLWGKSRKTETASTISG